MNTTIYDQIDNLLDKSYFYKLKEKIRAARKVKFMLSWYT